MPTEVPFTRRPIHPFPARMAPSIALEALGAASNAGTCRVLDPMSGSGTVLAVAKAAGHRAFGFDLDPLAVLLARTWTTTSNADDVVRAARNVLARAKKEFKTTPLSRAYPDKADDETKRFIRYWFDDYARRQLAALAGCIGRVRNPVTRDALWSAFSRMIIVKQAGASLAMDLAHSRPHKAYRRAPVKPFNRFVTAAEYVARNCPQPRGRRGPRTRVSIGDARALPIASESIDLVVTSPPYLNAIDYLRSSKFSLVWMGQSISSLRTVRASSIGTEVALCDADTQHADALAAMGAVDELPDRQFGWLRRYVRDMAATIKEISRVLRASGRAVLVVGNSTIRGTFVSNSAAIRSLAESSGLDLAERTRRPLPPNRRYLPPPQNHSGAMNSRMREEVVLVFVKNGS